MARSQISRAEVIVRRESYYWPDQQLNLLIFIMLGSGGTLVGIFAQFTMIQGQLGGLGVPWIMPFGITVGALTLMFCLIIIGLVAQRRLLPGVVILGAFILAVLYITGLVETAIQLFGPTGNIQGNCQQYVFSQPQRTLSIDTLAWLEQQGICQAWQAAFAFWIIGVVFLIYLIIVATNVSRGNYDT